MLAIDWKVDTTMPTMIELKGYEAGYKTSDISGQNRLYYDRSKPYTGQVPFYNTFYAKDSVTIPKAYVVSQGWHKVIDLLQKNGVQQIRRLQYDSTVTATVYYIEDYQTTPKPYEGHYLHSKVKVRAAQHELKLHKGDYIINMNEYQDARRYLVEMLEPTAPDAFFAWGFFDAVLQQKEYFSDYAFEELGMELLQKDEILKAKLEERRKADATFAKDGEQQLDFLYQNCCYHEAEHMRYPVFRLD